MTNGADADWEAAGAGAATSTAGWKEATIARAVVAVVVGAGPGAVMVVTTTTAGAAFAATVLKMLSEPSSMVCTLLTTSMASSHIAHVLRGPDRSLPGNNVPPEAAPSP